MIIVKVKLVLSDNIDSSIKKSLSLYDIAANYRDIAVRLLETLLPTVL